MKLEEFELNKRKSESRPMVNLTLLGISFTLFALIVAINPGLLNNKILTYQLVLSIPFFMSFIFARSKLAYTLDTKKWNMWGFITFILGYGFLINSVGLLLASFIDYKISLVFFIINIISAVTYSIIQISCDRSALKSRICQNLAFIVIVVVLGILPLLSVF